MMDEATCELVIQVLRECRIGALDITGGAPELHPAFRTLVEAATQLGVKVMDRCNLTILFEPGQEGLADFLARRRVDVIASLPCYSSKNVDQQRGDGVFAKSIAGLRQLNVLGYGQSGSGLTLDLVYNPLGASLPPPQAALEEDYRRELFKHSGVTFNHLYTLANMPIQRFGSTLISKGQFSDYIRLLKENFAAANLEQVMCRDLISVDWRGDLYDCDFNQQLGLRRSQQHGAHLRDLLRRSIDGDPIIVADHCYGCTAGQGSSCGGALTS
jgi:radical SAM/Cys-rich protein